MLMLIDNALGPIASKTKTFYIVKKAYLYRLVVTSLQIPRIVLLQSAEM